MSVFEGWQNIENFLSLWSKTIYFVRLLCSESHLLRKFSTEQRILFHFSIKVLSKFFWENLFLFDQNFFCQKHSAGGKPDRKTQPPLPLSFPFLPLSPSLSHPLFPPSPSQSLPSFVRLHVLFKTLQLHHPLQLFTSHLDVQFLTKSFSSN